MLLLWNVRDEFHDDKSDDADDVDDDVGETTGFSVKPFGHWPTLDHLKGSVQYESYFIGEWPED